jgi:hypothetical protein
VAADLLTDQARRGVVGLLGNGDAKIALIEVSTWADDIRNHRPDSRHWHYVNIPISTPVYDAARDCPAGDCVVGAIDRMFVILADQTLIPAVRAEALRWLVHFVADVHQPLHAGDNGDRGGNDVKVRIRGHTSKLHAWWDADVIQAMGDRDQLVARLEAKLKVSTAKNWAAGTAANWATESAEISRSHVYGGWLTGTGPATETIVLPDEYVTQAASTAEQQLAKAAIRLATVLNAALR